MLPYLERIYENVVARDPEQKEFHQAVKEVLESLEPTVERHPEFVKAGIYERIVEFDRAIQFRVPWVDDSGKVQVNRGFRVQFNNAIGPYKGGLRFHPSVTLSIIKFLGFEQTFKNALTTLPMGGGKGGSDFNPKGKSEAEIMRFCQAFMRELYRHIGADTDVPAGDIGVGGREIGFLYGYYKKIVNENRGVLTGKGLEWGGSLIRPEATGYGAIYFAEEMLKTKNQTLKDKVISLSGFGNVAWGAAQKALSLGAKVVTVSGPDGYVHIPGGMNDEMVDYLLDLRASNQDIVEPFASEFENCTFHKGEKPWCVKADIAMPCATQNELNGDDAQKLIDNGVSYVAEVSNMGCTPEAVKLFHSKNILFAPGKAVNAGGVATSGLEMSQNSLRLNWSAEEVDEKLHTIMVNIHNECLKAAETYGSGKDYVAGANIAGFMKVANAMLAQGIV
jgi:glutamate dehydrogenase (NADP+)